MLINRIVLPARVRAWRNDRRWRRAIRMEVAEEVANRLWADGYRFGWRVSRGQALGHTLAGEAVSIPFEEFITRYFAGGRGRPGG